MYVADITHQLSLWMYTMYTYLLYVYVQDPRLLTLGCCTCWLASYLLSTRCISPQTRSAISTCSHTCRLRGGHGNQGSLSHRFPQDPMLAQCSSMRQRYIYSDVLMWTVCSIVCCLSNKNHLYLTYCTLHCLYSALSLVLLTLQSRSLFLLSGTTPTGVDLFRLSIDSKMDSLLPWKHKRKQVTPYQHFLVCVFCLSKILTCVVPCNVRI